MKRNILLMSDSYKYSHYLQYPEGTTMINSYIEARGSKDPDLKKVVFFGLQMFLKEYLNKPFTQEDIDEAAEMMALHGEPFNRKGFEYILRKHGGFFPVMIEALPEGIVVPLGTPLVQVKNTDPNVPWVTSFVETMLLRAVWYPTTVATYSWTIKQMLLDYAEKSGSDLAGVNFKLHDFGARGVSSEESARIGGLAHIVNFMGTDTVSSLVAAREYYSSEMPAFSIPAAEHSTMTLEGPDGELNAFRRMLNQFAQPNKMVAVVSDSYDIYNAVDNYWGKELKQEVLDSGATVVIRPDSGDPTVVPIEVIKSLMNSYGYEVNEKGYKTLPSSIRVIQGDGIDKESIRWILENMEEEKFSLDNIAFGMGGALLQKLDRDTLSFAMKASAAKINGKVIPVQKNPVTDSGKNSKAGIQTVVKFQKLYENLLSPVWNSASGCLQPLTFDQVRENTNTVYEEKDLMVRSLKFTEDV